MTEQPPCPARAAHDAIGRLARRTYDVPAVVRNRALAAGATGWIDDLPELVASLERE